MSTTSDLSQKVTEHAAEMTAQVKATAKAETAARAESAKRATAESVQTVADATQAAANEFDIGAPQAQAMNQVADHIEDLAERMRTADVQELASQATDFARRNPVLFIGGAALAGLAVARFLKARDPNQTSGTALQDPWSQPNERKAGFAQTNGGHTNG